MRTPLRVACLATVSHILMHGGHAHHAHCTGRGLRPERQLRAQQQLPHHVQGKDTAQKVPVTELKCRCGTAQHCCDLARRRTSARPRPQRSPALAWVALQVGPQALGPGEPCRPHAAPTSQQVTITHALAQLRRHCCPGRCGGRHWPCNRCSGRQPFRRDPADGEQMAGSAGHINHKVHMSHAAEQNALALYHSVCVECTLTITQSACHCPAAASLVCISFARPASLLLSLLADCSWLVQVASSYSGDSLSTIASRIAASL